jgi:hypothetical protein
MADTLPPHRRTHHRLDLAQIWTYSRLGWGRNDRAAFDSDFAAFGSVSGSGVVGCFSRVFVLSLEWGRESEARVGVCESEAGVGFFGCWGRGCDGRGCQGGCGHSVYDTKDWSN